MNDSIKYDKSTSEWFRNHVGEQATVCQCDKCGLFYKSSLGHKCVSKDNPELLEVE